MAKEIYTRVEMVDNIQGSLKMYWDNEPAMFYAHNNNSSGAAK
jgi:hypothetical protein